jgi:hypothetical protein
MVSIEESGYSQALTRVLEIREQRRKVYGDSWALMEDWELCAMIKIKTNRLLDFIINKKDRSLYENEIDTLIDLTNYSLFLLENKLRGGHK